MNVKKKGESFITRIQRKPENERKKIQYFMVAVVFIVILITVFILSKIQVAFNNAEPKKDVQELINRVKERYKEKNPQLESTYQGINKIKEEVVDSAKEEIKNIESSESLDSEAGEEEIINNATEKNELQ